MIFDLCFPSCIILSIDVNSSFPFSPIFSSDVILMVPVILNPSHCWGSQSINNWWLVNVSNSGYSLGND